MSVDNSKANKSPKKSFLGKLFGGASDQVEPASPALLKQEPCLTISWIRNGILEIKVTNGEEVFDAVLEASAYQSKSKPIVGAEVEEVKREMGRMHVRLKQHQAPKPQASPKSLGANIKKLYGT